EDGGEVSSLRIDYGRMVQPYPLRSRGRSILAVPRVQTDVVMISACRHEGSLAAITGGELEPEQPTIKFQRSFEIRHLQMDVANASIGRDDVIVVHIPKLNVIGDQIQYYPLAIFRILSPLWRLSNIG